MVGEIKMTESELREYVNSSDITPTKEEVETYKKTLQYLKEDGKDYGATMDHTHNFVNSVITEERKSLKEFLALVDSARLNLTPESYNKVLTYFNRNLNSEEKDKALDTLKGVYELFIEQDKSISDQIEAILSEVDKTKKFDAVSEVESLTNLILDKQTKAKYKSLYLIYKADLVRDRNIEVAYDLLNSATDYIDTITDETISSMLRIKQAAVRRKVDTIKKENNKSITNSNDLPKNDNAEIIKKVNKLLDEAERKLDVKLLEEACELIKTLPDGEEKKKLNKRAADIENKIIKNEINKLLDEAERNLDRKALDKACDLINKMPNGDDKNDLQARAAEIDKLIREKEKDNDLGGDGDDLDPPKPELPKIEGNSPKKTWKTWVALAAGIGVGATVFFTCGTVGVSVMAIAGGIAKRLISKRRKKLEMQRLNGELPVESAEEPLPGIKGKIQKLKEYFKSEEFCRDATWFLNGAIYTGLGLNIASSIYNFASAHINPGDVTPTNPTPNPSPNPNPDLTPVNNPTPVNTNPMDGIRIGDNVGGYNVSVGHDTASWATSGTHTENLISEYVNSGSVFKRFAVMNPDGSVGQIINTNGLSITDFCNQAGIDPSQIAVDVASKSGTSQAWVSTSELLEGVGGKTL